MIKFIIFIYTQLYILLNIEQVFLFRRIWYPKSQQFQKYYKKKVRMSTSNRELLYFAVQVCREPWIWITEVHDFFMPFFIASIKMAVRNMAGKGKHTPHCATLMRG